jgi:hypothetical protein
MQNYKPYLTILHVVIFLLYYVFSMKYLYTIHVKFLCFRENLHLANFQIFNRNVKAFSHGQDPITFTFIATSQSIVESRSPTSQMDV